MGKALDRVRLLDRIGTELQSQFSYNDIDLYLSGYDIGASEKYEGPNSKRLYARHLLMPADMSTLISIAKELGITDFSLNNSPSEGPINWRDIKERRCFISHISKDKKIATRLSLCMAAHGYSCFVAHEDIHPTVEWAHEILRALRVMDCFVSIHTEGFSNSEWCQQEVGFALATEVPYVALKMDEDPVGFQGIRQALPRGIMSAEEVASRIEEIFSQQMK